MAFTKVPTRVLSELKELLTNANIAKQRCEDYARATGLALGVDMNDPKVALDFEKGGFVSPDLVSHDDVTLVTEFPPLAEGPHIGV